MSIIITIVASALGGAILTQLGTLLVRHHEERHGALYLALLLEKYAEDCALIAWESEAYIVEPLPDFPNYREDIETKTISLATLADIAKVDLQVAGFNRISKSMFLRAASRFQLPRNAYFVATNALDTARKIRMRHGIVYPENERVEVTRTNLRDAAKKFEK